MSSQFIFIDFVFFCFDFFFLSFEVLVKIYFSIARQSTEKWGKERETFPVPHIGNSSKRLLF
jgi:hypothetical protein